METIKLPVEDKEQLEKACVQRLEEIEHSLRLSGFYRRAEKVQRFREKYFEGGTDGKDE